MQQRKIKVWNKTVIINDVPDYVTDEELVRWTKKALLLDELNKSEQQAS